MKVFFRVDASINIGVGHVVRCLVLAEELRNLGASIGFITRDHLGNLNKQIKDNDFFLYSLPFQKRAIEKKKFK